MTLKDPVLLIEILSKTTEGYNRGAKFENYRSIPALVEYLMVDSQRLYVELWRKENEKWVLSKQTKDLTDTIELMSVGDTFLLSDFYYQTEELINQQQFLIR